MEMLIELTWNEYYIKNITLDKYLLDLFILN